jgi:hypothetical protein
MAQNRGFLARNIVFLNFIFVGMTGIVKIVRMLIGTQNFTWALSIFLN